jgi:hypothetical protein
MSAPQFDAQSVVTGGLSQSSCGTHHGSKSASTSVAGGGEVDMLGPIESLASKGVEIEAATGSSCGSASGTLGSIHRKLETTGAVTTGVVTTGAITTGVVAAAGGVAAFNSITDAWLVHALRNKACSSPERIAHRITASEIE